MSLESLIDLLKTKADFFKSTQFGYVEILSGKLGESLSFSEEAMLDKFANSKPEDTEQVVLKTYGSKKTLFIANKEYDVILNYNGEIFSLSQLWKRRNRRTEIHPVDQEKFKAEILRHFSTVKNQKLVS